MNLSNDTVCGYDKTTYIDGNEQTHALEYRTPCHYCNFCGDDMEMNMMGTIVKGLDYKKGLQINIIRLKLVSLISVG